MLSWSKVFLSLFLCLLVSGCPHWNPGGDTYYGNHSHQGSDHHSANVIHFDFDKSEIKDEYKDIVLGAAAYLQDNPGANLLIVGHTDERGTEDYNMALGERRAYSVKKLIVSCAPELESRIKIDSEGKSNPVVHGHDEESWAQNRRAVFSYHN